MKFGRMEDDEVNKAQHDIIVMICGITKFAWLPTKVKDGRWVWLENYKRYYSGRVSDDGVYGFWYFSNNRPAYDDYVFGRRSAANIFCTKPISKEDRREDQISYPERLNLISRAEGIERMRT